MKISNRQRQILQWAWAIWVCSVVIGSLLPASSPVIVRLDRLQISDKVLHFFAYLILAALPVMSFANRTRGIIMSLLMIVLGLALEGGQTFSPGRTPEIGDAIANSLGVLSGVLVGLPLRL